jgi:large subunit ribosomal protein L9
MCTSSRALADSQLSVHKRQVQLAEPIKTIGEFPVTLRVFSDVTAEIKVHVEKEA